MANRICSNSKCGRPLGNPTWTIRDRSEEYCSRSCRDDASPIAGKKGKKKVKTESAEVPGTSQTLCDLETCRKPVILAWAGKKGTYCSNDCLEEAEGEAAASTPKNKKGKAKMATPEGKNKKLKDKADKKAAKASEPDDIEEEEEAEEESEEEEEAEEEEEEEEEEVAVAKPAKTAKKTAAKAKGAPAKKATKGAKGAAKKHAKATRPEGKERARGTFAAESVIKVLNKENPFRGERAKRHALLKNGMTVAQFQEALKKAKLGTGVTRPLERAIEQKLISVGK